MAAKAGVWIDHQQAIVVLITDNGPKIKKVNSVAQQTVRSKGSSRAKKKYTPNDFIAEDRQERKLASDRKKYYDEVLACIRGANSLLILGPGQAKGELSKQVTAKKLRGLAVEVETADRMSDRQIAAKVSEHFAKSSAAKSVAPKKPIKAKRGKAMPGSRTKETGK
jgi:hypothetical protein